MAFLRHLALRCRDVEVSRRFYEQAIGFRFIGYRSSTGTGSIDLTDGTLNITLLPYAGQRADFEEGDEYIHFGIYVDDLQAAWHRLKGSGAPGVKTVKGRNEIDQDAPPELAFKVTDPDGNVIDVTGDPGEWRGIEV